MRVIFVCAKINCVTHETLMPGRLDTSETLKKELYSPFAKSLLNNGDDIEHAIARALGYCASQILSCIC